MAALMRLQTDGNGGIIVSKGLAWVLGIAMPVLTALGGFGLSQAVSIAEMQEQINDNQEDIAELNKWGPTRGDRYTASDARNDWSGHASMHSSSDRLHLEKLAEIQARLAAIESKLK